MTSPSDPTGARDPRTLDDLLASAAKATEREQAPPGFADRVLARIERQEAPRARRRLRWLPAGIAAAASALLATYLVGRDAGERHARRAEPLGGELERGQRSPRADELSSDMARHEAPAAPALAQQEPVALLAERFPRSPDGAFYAVADIAPDDLRAALDATLVAQSPVSLKSAGRLEDEGRRRGKTVFMPEARREERVNVPVSQGERLFRLLDSRHPGAVQPLAQLSQAGLYRVAENKLPASGPSVAQNLVEKKERDLDDRSARVKEGHFEPQVEVVVYTRER